MNALTTVLAAVDFSDCSKAALRQAVRIARWNDATLHVLHVIERDLEDLLESSGLSNWQKITGDINDRRRIALDTFTAEVAGENKTFVDVRSGHPVRTLIETVRSTMADVLVMGMHSADRAGAGPLATAAIRSAPTKVLLVHEKHEGKFRRIVAAVDFSETSKRALLQAIRIAQQDGAPLEIVNIFPTARPEMAFVGNPLGIWPVDWQTVFTSWQLMRDSIVPSLRSFTKDFEPEMTQLQVRYHAAEADSHGDGLVTFAKDHDADLVVLGTRGKTNLRYMFMGSTAERVVRDTPCSILAVKPEKFSVGIE